MVEGVFSRAFKSNVRPIEIGRRMVREIDAKRTVDSNGRRVVPNQFLIRLSPDDHRALADIAHDLIVELETAAETYCADEGYHLRGPVVAEIREDSKLTKGRVVIESEVVTSRADVSEPEGPRPTSSGPSGLGAPSGPENLESSRPRRSTLVLTDGRELPLGTHPVVIGRLPECDISFDDSNLSRRHAEISFHMDIIDGRRVTRYTITDLGSTNGTKVNGSPIGGPVLLRAGDVITVGLYSITFVER